MRLGSCAALSAATVFESFEFSNVSQFSVVFAGKAIFGLPGWSSIGGVMDPACSTSSSMTMSIFLASSKAELLALWGLALELSRRLVNFDL